MKPKGRSYGEHDKANGKAGSGRETDAFAEEIEAANRLADQGRHEEALAVLQDAIEAAEPTATFNAGNSLLALGRPREAAKLYRIAGEAGESDAWFNLGLALTDLGKPRAALNALFRSAAHGDMKGRAGAGWELWNRGLKREAEQLLSMTARADPWSAGVLGHLLFEECSASGSPVPSYVVEMLTRGAHVLPDAQQDLDSIDAEDVH